MPGTVLITGGAGFVGRHVARALLEQGHRVRALDSLIEQVHPTRARPAELDPEVELMVGDIRDEAAVMAALSGVDKVVHLAAEVGVGQSMYAIDRYTSVNDYGTAVLFQQLIDRPVERVVVASSMSIYGEGLYLTSDDELVEDVVRGPRNPDGSWDPLDARGRPLIPVPTPETKQPALKSVYAINKYVQERLTLTLTAQYGMQSCALRLWNIYGPGQALSNPYTGVLAIFASRIANGQAPMVFEDGRQRRDFVHVSDVARAFLLALDRPEADGEVFNIGSGVDRTVEEVARLQAESMGRPDIVPEITQQARAGDIRHNIPDLTKAADLLGYEARQDFAEGLEELAEWVARQEAEDRVVEARKELEMRGLVA
ncbi:MAG: SDR family NAD(P)-dependent oxidoreductase [Brevundimonas sp.]|jgi:dTDP-L-rhamnose 4-epimerase|uniref:NAD-dependent epimerase/dehydratase family protein n=1 Tax=Brevundimonas sp. TaxID=1871086 RepID=UPI0018593919|nr:SDR family NAD(P)-dependent oxidoreductase [Brevundimonas sp.]MBA4803858.1 SDR family NAD(P)-dependent oxidoreductase [Brevundimonas sp.]